MKANNHSTTNNNKNSSNNNNNNNTNIDHSQAMHIVKLIQYSCIHTMQHACVLSA